MDELARRPTPATLRELRARVRHDHARAGIMALNPKAADGGILATKVGLIGDRHVNPGDVDCWRCGIEFNRYTQNVIKGAPCRDCRDVLRDLGDQTVWDRRRQQREDAAA